MGKTPKMIPKIGNELAKEGRGSQAVGDSGKNVKRIPGSEILWAKSGKGEGRETMEL